MDKVLKLIVVISVMCIVVNADSVSESNMMPSHIETKKSSLWTKIISYLEEDNKVEVNCIVKTAKQKLGRKYVWGAVGKRDTFDCSGLTQYVYRKNGILLPRTSRYQSKFGKRIARNALQPGDLIFFDTSKKHKGYVNHVGIYIGQGEFLHASSAKRKVVISKLDKTFYDRRFKVARRPL